MRLLERIVDISNIEAEEPIAFGGFHLFCALLAVAISAILCVKLRDRSDRVYRRIICAMFIVMFLFEVYKETILAMSTDTGKIVYEYDWNAFPFQLCSTPLYVLPLLAFLPDSPMRDAAAAYTMTFAFIGGVSVFLVPSSVFTPFVFMNVQTMVHHGIQVISGAFTAAHYRRRVDKRFYLLGAGMFSVFFLIANLLNTLGYDLLVRLGAFEEGFQFNMFYISPRPDQTMPVLDNLFDLVSPILFIMLYYLVLLLGAALVCYCVIRLNNLCENTLEKRGKTA